MNTWAQISSPPHWHVPMDCRAALWRATFCTLLSAISSRSFLLRVAALRGIHRPYFPRSPNPGKDSPDQGKKPRNYSQPFSAVQEKNELFVNFEEQGSNGVSLACGDSPPSFYFSGIDPEKRGRRQPDRHAPVRVILSNATSKGV
jgi:hypothetical protein